MSRTTAPMMPVRITSTAVRLGMPPTASETPSATGAGPWISARAKRMTSLRQTEGQRQQDGRGRRHDRPREQRQKDRRDRAADGVAVLPRAAGRGATVAGPSRKWMNCAPSK